MDEQYFYNQIAQLEGAYDQHSNEIAQLRRKLEDTQHALDRSRDYQNQFHDVVSRQRSQCSNIQGNNGLRVLGSIMNRLSDVFSGQQFHSASNSIQQGIDAIVRKIEDLQQQINDHYSAMDSIKRELNTVDAQLKQFRIDEAKQKVEAAKKQ